MKREEIVRQARKFLGVPFQHQGRSIRGIDCVGLVLCVAEGLGIRDSAGKPIGRHLYEGYSAQPLSNVVQDRCNEHLVRKTVKDMREGDVLTLAIPSSPCHVAIVGLNPLGEFTLIHAYAGGAKKCQEHPIDLKWCNRIVNCYSFPGVED